MHKSWNFHLSFSQYYKSWTVTLLFCINIKENIANCSRPCNNFVVLTTSLLLLANLKKKEIAEGKRLQFSHFIKYQIEHTNHLINCIPNHIPIVLFRLIWVEHIVDVVFLLPHEYFSRPCSMQIIINNWTLNSKYTIQTDKQTEKHVQASAIGNQMKVKKEFSEYKI